MANLTATTPTRAGVVVTGAAVSASDKIPASVIGARGCIYKCINGNASPNAMTISDSSTTLTGAAAAANAPSVANGTSKAFLITPAMADANGDVTITNSVTATVTYELYPLG